VRPDLGQIEGVEPVGPGLLEGHDLHLQRPTREVAVADRVEQVLAVVVGALAGDPVGLVLRQEVDETTVRKANPVVVDSRPSALKEAGDLLPSLEKGRLHAGALVELGEIIAGIRPGRTNREQVTLFESQGMAMQDLIIASDIVRMAREKGLGEEVAVGS